MATKKLKGLGRGLDALLGGGGDFASPDTHQPSSLPVSQMQAGKYQPRTRMDEGALNELAASIKAQGLMQPILVRPIGQDTLSGLVKYEIIAGERRFRASQLAGLTEVPVLVRDVDDLAAAAMALIENIQREDLNPLEEAQGIHRLIADFSFTHEQAATALGRSRSAVSNLLRLTQLAKPAQEYLLGGALEMGHARALLALPAAQQTATAARVVNGQLSVRETERLVETLLHPAKRAARRAQHAARDADTARLETELAEKLGARVRIEPGRKGAGRVVIGYSSLEELDGILARIR